jgi:hypothetical protein
MKLDPAKEVRPILIRISDCSILQHVGTMYARPMLEKNLRCKTTGMTRLHTSLYPLFVTEDQLYSSMDGE